MSGWFACRRCSQPLDWPTAEQREFGWYCPSCGVKDPAVYSQQDFILFLQRQLEELQLLVLELQEQLCGKSK